MKKVDVKVFFQKNNSNDCGSVCVQMALHHFGITKKLDDLKKNITFVVNGSYIYDNGLLVLKEGLKAELITANPLVFKREARKELKSDRAILSHLSKMQRRTPDMKNAFRIFKEYIYHGGKTRIEIPCIDHITKAIDENKLVIALIYSGALGKKEGKGFHFVVVTGYKKDHVYINNPVRSSRQGWFLSQDFLYALHSSTTAGIDNGSLLIVGK